MRGFSLIEMMIVLSVLLIVTGIGFMSLQPVLKQTRATNAYNSVLGTLRRAHDEAVAERRVYLVTFDDSVIPHKITVTQNDNAGKQLVQTVLPTDITFHVEGTMPAPAPDGFGTGGKAIDFDQGVGAGGTKTIYFYPDSSAHDASVNGSVNSGVVYFGRAGDLTSMRAITVWGTTGRIRGWRVYGNKWSQQ